MYTDDQIDWTSVFSALTNEQRRNVIRRLMQTTGTTTLTELAEHLSGDDHIRGEGSDADCLRTELYHVHLPKLADAGLIVWDRSQETASLTTLVSHLPVGVILPHPATIKSTARKQSSD
ncbi:DUF7344 domain-containing protein [Natrinema marinum]|uniref:DUF7344 domain-containing protein n=1 Tax=Natrinema marinum TaxID=2961598 RepID=UPI003CE57907